MKRLGLPVVCVVLALGCAAPAAQAEVLANKLVLFSHFGWDVNKTAVENPSATQAEKNLCTVASKDECQLLFQESSQTGAFNYPYSVAVDNDAASSYHGDVYVADSNNHRVQVFTAAGAFVSMFGGDVNRTAEEKGASQAERNVCTAESGDVCQAGVKGEAAGQMSEPASVAVDSSTGDVYLAERVFGVAGGEAAYNFRVQAFTAQGEWLFEIGQEVNATTKGNLCSQAEAEKGATCKGPTLIPVRAAHGSSEHGVFNPAEGRGNIIALGGPEDLLYVGDEHRVQEFSATGEWHGEIPLTSLSGEPRYRVTALTVDLAGDVYLTYNYVDTGTSVIHELAPAGTQAAEFEVKPDEATSGAFGIETLALDPHGRLAVMGAEEAIRKSGNEVHRGFLYNGAGARISEFTPPSGSIPGNAIGAAFSASDELYVATSPAQEIEVFAPALFPESVTCAASEVGATGATLCGQINPNGLEARGFFSYGPPAGAQTPTAFKGSGETFAAVSQRLNGLTPNETYTYRMSAEAQVNGEQVSGSGGPVSFHTATPPPEVAGAPSAGQVSDTFALLTASLNPEHAPTRYHFEYGRCAALAECAQVLSTPDLESSVYGGIGTVQEVAGLQPQSTYSFRLVADNEHEEAGHVMQGGSATGAEGHLTTAALPLPAAQTGAASQVTAGGATVSGLVNPDGQAAVYAFELGVFRGAQTQYGIVFSGPAGDGTAAVPESLALTGLQPGTTYAYRVTLRSGYGEAVGGTQTFTTAGLPAALSVTPALPMLPVPSIAFPAQSKGGKGTPTHNCGKGRGRGHRRCAGAKRKPRRSAARKAGKKR